MRDEVFQWWAVPAIVVTEAVAAPACAVQYLSVAEAQQVLFPEADGFISSPVRLSNKQKEAVERYAGIRLRADEQPVWRVEKDGVSVGWFLLDEVYGKHEFITYAMGLDRDGTVRGLEILNYRESHGGEVRNENWRAQFDGKRYGDQLRLGKDVENISGATLSCKHLTEGVRRLLAIYRAALK